MKRYTLIYSLLLSLLSPSIAIAKGGLELTPHIGYRFGGEFDLDEPGQSVDLEEKSSLGLTLAWDYDRKRQGELHLSHYSAELEDNEYTSVLENNELSITYLHLGGNLPISDGILPFWLSGGLGLTHFSPDDGALNNETKFSANLGLNTRIALSENTAFKVGGRLYGTFLNSESSMFCDAEDCKIYVSSDVWIQSEVYAGITFTF